MPLSLLIQMNKSKFHLYDYYNLSARNKIIFISRYVLWLYVSDKINHYIHYKVKVKVIPQQAEVSQGVPGRLRPRIFLTFGTTRVVGRQSYAPAAFTPG